MQAFNQGASQMYILSILSTDSLSLLENPQCGLAQV